MPCRSAALAAHVGFTYAAAGSIGQSVYLINNGPRACSIRGFPRVTFLDAHGQPLRTRARHDGAMLFDRVRPSRLTLPPHGQASFVLGGGDSDPNTGTCPTAPAMRVRLPRTTATLTVQHLKWPYCDRGSVDLSPLVGGDSGPGKERARLAQHQVVAVSPDTGLRNGETVTVTVTGFPDGAKVFLSECSPDREDLAAAGCGAELAAEPVLYTDDHGAGSARFVVHFHAADETCARACAIAATAGGLPRFHRRSDVTTSSISFATVE
jgi:Protein of unknown function (DUF4232)/Neocarzinostatin family